MVGYASRASSKGSASVPSCTPRRRVEGLTGFVANDIRGRSMEVEGRPSSHGHFVARLEPEPPPLAAIERIVQNECDCGAWRGGFRDPLPSRDGGRARDAGVARRRDVRRLPARDIRPGRDRRLALRLHQLHELRAALHDCPRPFPTIVARRPWRPSRCASSAPASTTTLATVASMRSPSPAPPADQPA